MTAVSGDRRGEVLPPAHEHAVGSLAVAKSKPTRLLLSEGEILGAGRSLYPAVHGTACSREAECPETGSIALEVFEGC